MKSVSNLTGCTSRDSKSTLRLAVWTGLWLATTALAAFGPHALWDRASVSLAVIALSAAAGIGMLIANLRHLQALDELMRKVQLEAMGYALGSTVVAGIAYSLLETSGLLDGHAEISFLILLTGIVYVVAILAGLRKYR